MPRPKVIDRKRVLRACASCKRRKEKCDGLRPCLHCKMRNQEDACTYLNPTAGAPSVSPSPIRAQAQPSEATIDPVDSVLALEPRQSFPRNTASQAGDFAGPSTTSPTSAPVPKLSRFLQNPRGKLIYIGDSASLSFLQTVRRIVESSIGPCHFTTDRLRHQLIETSSTPHNAEIAADGSLPSPDEALILIREFAVAVSGALDLFDASVIADSIHCWVEDPMRSRWPDCSIFYLVLAIGAQARARDYADDLIAEQYFKLGRNHALRNLVDDLSILTVQAFCLITWYMVTACRRNGALMNIGLAVQAAYALGIHTQEANASFPREMAISRERAWKTLRVCDLFLSASMGRPSITSHIDSSSPSESISPSDPNDRLSSAMSRICLIFERILSEVYSHRAVSLELATDISKQHREWTEELPGMLEVDGISSSEMPGSVDLAKTLGSAIVVMAYYYSIILLTRPFLTFRVNSYIKNKGFWPDRPGKEPDVTMYADACVTSAINGIEIAHDVIKYENMPKRLPLIVNSVFMSALALGLAYFGDYNNRGWALEQALEQAIGVLQHFGVRSPQSSRYQQIVELLRDATVDYKDQRHEDTLQLHKQQISIVFGNVLAQLDRGRISTVTLNEAAHFGADGSIPAFSTMHSETNSAESAPSPFPNFGTILQNSMITTTGKLAPKHTGHDSNHASQYLSADDQFAVFGDDLFGNSANDLFFMEEMPLFTLMNEYHPA